MQSFKGHVLHPPFSTNSSCGLPSDAKVDYYGAFFHDPWPPFFEGLHFCCWSLPPTKWVFMVDHPNVGWFFLPWLWHGLLELMVFRTQRTGCFFLLRTIAFIWRWSGLAGLKDEDLVNSEQVIIAGKGETESLLYIVDLNPTYESTWTMWAVLGTHNRPERLRGGANKTYKGKLGWFPLAFGAWLKAPEAIRRYMNAGALSSILSAKKRLVWKPKGRLEMMRWGFYGLMVSTSGLFFWIFLVLFRV